MERIAGQRGCLMDRGLCYSIICCATVGNKDAEMLRCSEQSRGERVAVNVAH